MKEGRGKRTRSTLRRRRFELLPAWKTSKERDGSEGIKGRMEGHERKDGRKDMEGRKDMVGRTKGGTGRKDGRIGWEWEDRKEGRMGQEGME